MNQIIKIWIWAGAISESNNLKPRAHIFINFAGNYYTIPDDVDHFFGADKDIDGIDA